MHSNDYEFTRRIVDVGDGHINRLNDRYIKYLFGNPANKDILQDFINDVLLLEGTDAVFEIKSISGELAQDRAGMKLSRIDISAELGDGRTVDIEIQVVNRHDFKKRAPYYWAMRHVQKLVSGVFYVDIKPTILICVLAFDLFAEEFSYRNTYRIRNDKSGNELCEDLQIVYIELPKFLRQVDMPVTGLERWLSYLSNVRGEKMTTIAEADPILANAISIEGRYWADKKELARYFAQQKAMLDEISREGTSDYLLKKEKEKNLIAREEGKQEAKLATARNLLAMGLAADEVAQAVELSEEEVRELIS